MSDVGISTCPQGLIRRCRKSCDNWTGILLAVICVRGCLPTCLMIITPLTLPASPRLLSLEVAGVSKPSFVHALHAPFQIANSHV